MAFSKVPSTWLGGGYTLSGSIAGFTTNTSGGTKCLTQLTDTDAHATTGDIRNIAFAIAEKLYQAWVTQGSSGQPEKMKITRSAIGASDGTLTYSYTLSFKLTPGGTYSLTAEV